MAKSDRRKELRAEKFKRGEKKALLKKYGIESRYAKKKREKFEAEKAEEG